MTLYDQHNTQIEGLAICYTTFNSMRTLPQSLKSACELSGQVVVVDSGSTDGTLELCAEYGIVPEYRKWANPSEQKRFALSLCKDATWTLLLDSDETILDDLAASIRAALMDTEPDCAGFALNRVTWLDGQPLRHAFQPEWRLRLVQSNQVIIKSDPSGVHDHLEVTAGRCRRLQGILRHDSWLDAGDMLDRGVRWGVTTGRAATRGGHALNLFFNPAWSFLKQLVIKRAILDGWRGWVAAGGVAVQTLCKHITIMEQRGQQREADRSSE